MAISVTSGGTTDLRSRPAFIKTLGKDLADALGGFIKPASPSACLMYYHRYPMTYPKAPFMQLEFYR